jgi:hypothetical protein
MFPVTQPGTAPVVGAGGRTERSGMKKVVKAAREDDDSINNGG